MSDLEARLNARYPEREMVKQIVRRCDCDKDDAKSSIMKWNPYRDQKRLDLVLDTIDMRKSKNVLATPDAQEDLPVTKRVAINYDDAELPNPPVPAEPKSIWSKLEPHIDFTGNEPWNEYKISDGTTLKTKFVLKKVVKTESGTNRYEVFAKLLTALYVDPELRGAPDDTEWKREDKINAIEEHDLLVHDIDVKPGEYRLNDGTELEICTNIIKVARTRLYDKNGDRIYLININRIVDIRSPLMLDAA